MSIPRRLFNAVFLLVWWQLYVIEAASIVPESLTGDSGFMDHTEPREPSDAKESGVLAMLRRKSHSKLEPEQRELMALKREDILIPGKSDTGGYPKVWLGYDVFGEGLQKLTDVRELNHTKGSRYSFFRMTVDEEVEEGIGW
ncbi:hypothetical protein FOZ61_006901 [Perkinsus olseni]|uniref:Uncharacterized protein n=1 Tax=Perkinsus olseni TaxID=32597 RepID=A0A7J6LBD2_PEROL|nr:hypothetical protein FOZ61_006901 [Perkinsus olseni]